MNNGGYQEIRLRNPFNTSAMNNNNNNNRSTSGGGSNSHSPLQQDAQQPPPPQQQQQHQPSASVDRPGVTRWPAPSSSSSAAVPQQQQPPLSHHHHHHQQHPAAAAAPLLNPAVQQMPDFYATINQYRQQHEAAGSHNLQFSNGHGTITLGNNSLMSALRRVETSTQDATVQRRVAERFGGGSSSGNSNGGNATNNKNDSQTSNNGGGGGKEAPARRPRSNNANTGRAPANSASVQSVWNSSGGSVPAIAAASTNSSISGVPPPPPAVCQPKRTRFLDFKQQQQQQQDGQQPLAQQQAAPPPPAATNKKSLEAVTSSLRHQNGSNNEPKSSASFVATRRTLLDLVGSNGKNTNKQGGTSSGSNKAAANGSSIDAFCDNPFAGFDNSNNSANSNNNNGDGACDSKDVVVVDDDDDDEKAAPPSSSNNNANKSGRSPQKLMQTTLNNFLAQGANTGSSSTKKTTAAGGGGSAANVEFTHGGTPAQHSARIAQKISQHTPSASICSDANAQQATALLNAVRAAGEQALRQHQNQQQQFGFATAAGASAAPSKELPMVRVSLACFTDKLRRPRRTCTESTLNGGSFEKNAPDDWDDDGQAEDEDDDDDDVVDVTDSNAAAATGSTTAGGSRSKRDKDLLFVHSGRPLDFAAEDAEIGIAPPSQQNPGMNYTRPPSLGIETNFSMWEPLGEKVYGALKAKLVFDTYPPSTAIDRLLVVMVRFGDEPTLVLDNGVAGINFVNRLRREVPNVDFVMFNTHAIIMPLLSLHCRYNQFPDTSPIFGSNNASTATLVAGGSRSNVTSRNNSMNTNNNSNSMNSNSNLGDDSQTHHHHHHQLPQRTPSNINRGLPNIPQRCFNDLRFMAKLLFPDQQCNGMEDIIDHILTLEADYRDTIAAHKHRENDLARLRANMNISNNNNNNNTNNAAAANSAPPPPPPLPLAPDGSVMRLFDSKLLTKQLVKRLADTPSDTIDGCMLRFDVTDEVFQALEFHVNQMGMASAYKTLDKQLPLIICMMKYVGCAILVGRLGDLDARIRNDIESRTQKIESYVQRNKPPFCANAPFNVLSTTDMRSLLYKQLGLEQHLNTAGALQRAANNNNNSNQIVQRNTKTKGGKLSTSESTLKILAAHHPLPAIIIQHRKLSHLRSTYFDGTFRSSRPIDNWIQQDATSATVGSNAMLSQHNNSNNINNNSVILRSNNSGNNNSGNNSSSVNSNFIPHPQHQTIRVIHCNFLQDGTETGRFSCNEPNLQNLPRIRAEDPTGYSNEVRRAFVPLRPDHCLLALDYEQIELRVLAALSGDRKLKATLTNPDRDKRDIHRGIAASVFNKPFDSVTNDERSRAKCIVFGTIYGMGPHALAAQLEQPFQAAQSLMSKFAAAFPEIDRFRQTKLEAARRNGYVATVGGHRRPIPDINVSSTGGGAATAGPPKAASSKGKKGGVDAPPDPRKVRAAAERKAFNTIIQGSAADIMRKAMCDVQMKVLATLPAGEQDDIFMLLQIHDELVFSVRAAKVHYYAKRIKRCMESLSFGGIKIIAKASYGPNFADLEPMELDETPDEAL